MWIRFRCLKYWLKGEDKGKTEIFVENLPGGPDNIKLAPDGSFWIALLQVQKFLSIVYWTRFDIQIKESELIQGNEKKVERPKTTLVEIFKNDMSIEESNKYYNFG